MSTPEGQKSGTSYALNLLIIGIAIILVVLVYQNVKNTQDSFVGRVPNVSIGNGPYYGNYNGIPPGSYPTGQPMSYPEQYYQSKYPYYNDSINHVGRPCSEQGGCGVLGVCQDGMCTVKDQDDTVYGIKL